MQDSILLGNTKSFRDWQHVFGVCDAMLKIVQADEPDDYITCSEETHSVEEFLSLAFSKLDLDYKKYLKFDPKYLRPLEVDYLLGDASHIKNKLGWKTSHTFDQLVTEMVEHDLKLAKQELLIKTHNK